MNFRILSRIEKIKSWNLKINLSEFVKLESIKKKFLKGLRIQKDS
ncbi:MAG: hypothetical protein PUB96_04555 [Helicobacteraceae bacterium]|nr:hypothetical protein [Helicobacteraceae bacterium]